MNSIGRAALLIHFGLMGAAFGQESEVRQAPGSPVAASPQPTPPLPEGPAGLAAKYPGDAGIENDPDVVFTESFSGSVEDICGRWDQAAGQPIMSISPEVPPGSRRKQSLLLTRVAGGTAGYQDGGNFYRRLRNDKGGYGYDQLFFRFYMKFNQEHAPIHHYGAGLIGYNPPSRWPLGGAGLRPKGDQSFITQVEPGDFKSWYFYTYWQEMGGSPPAGQTWGNTFEADVPARPVERERWICLELMVKMNDVGDSNGEQAYWLDGKLSRKGDAVTSYQGKGFPSSGTWYYDRFAPGVAKEGIAWNYAQKKGEAAPGGKPFPGFTWRSSPDLTINAVWLYRYMSKPETGTSKVWWSNLVVARKYIGPLSP
jgi:hypothetical protein